MEHDPLNILLADDDEDDRIFFKEALEEIRVKTFITLLNDGVELMNHLKDPGNRLPDVIFLDLNMPAKSGFDCLVEIRSDDRLRNLAIVIYSTSASDENIEEAFVQGANIYIKKPNDFSILKTTLEHVISLNWQYHTSGLKRENFLLNINTIQGDKIPKT